MSQPAQPNPSPPQGVEPPAPLAAAAPVPPSHSGGIFSPKVRLIAASVLLLGWFGWLIHTALTKNQAPIISRSQAALTESVVVAEVDFDSGVPTGKVTVKEMLWEAQAGKGPPSGAVIRVVNLAGVDGLAGPGQYLLLLTSELPGASEATVEPQFAVAPIPRPPDSDPSVGPKPRVYPWRESLRKQVKSLWPDAK